MDKTDISRLICKMPDRNTEAVCKQTLGVAFDLATEKMTDADSKEVV